MKILEVNRPHTGDTQAHEAHRAQGVTPRGTKALAIEADHHRKTPLGKINRGRNTPRVFRLGAQPRSLRCLTMLCERLLTVLAAQAYV